MTGSIGQSDNFLKQLWFFIAPKRNDHGLRCFPWKTHIALTIFVMALVLGCFVAIAYGAAEPRLAGFVTTDDFGRLAKKVDFLARDRIGEKITDKHWQMCQATGDFRKELQEQVSRLKVQYHEMFGTDFPIEDCRQNGA